MVTGLLLFDDLSGGFFPQPGPVASSNAGSISSSARPHGELFSRDAKSSERSADAPAALRSEDSASRLNGILPPSFAMVFASVNGEPNTAPFIVWLREQGKTVVLPEDDPAPDPDAVDVVIVPGTAFTADGHRLGQGGGWNDRFLPRLRPGTPKIGVGFAPQLVEVLPVEPHDVPLDLIVTDEAVYSAS